MPLRYLRGIFWWCWELSGSVYRGILQYLLIGVNVLILNDLYE